MADDLFSGVVDAHTLSRNFRQDEIFPTGRHQYLDPVLILFVSQPILTLMALHKLHFNQSPTAARVCEGPEVSSIVLRKVCLFWHDFSVVWRVNQFYSE